MNNAQKAAKILLEISAITLNPKKPFKYASGILSPVYIDNRILMGYPKYRRIFRDMYIDSIKSTKVKFDLIAGTATAGIPHAAWIADKMNLPMVYVRGKAKDHGKNNQIEGIIKKGQEVAVIEDLISTGESSVDAALATKEAGGKTSYIFAIITYEMQKSKDNFKNNKIKLIPITTFADIVEMAESLDKITLKEKDIILEWTKDPPSWGNKMGFE